jgi:membrane-associated phospholipid phosphatase
MYTEIMTQGVKSMVYRVRPDQSDTRSFFSGHTSTTFTMSSYMQREIDDALLDWSALSSTPLLRDALRAGSFALLYGWAAYVGYSRMQDNKHYLIDVLVGAGIGTLVGNLVYESVVGADGSFPVIGILSSGNGPQLAIQMHL